MTIKLTQYADANPEGEFKQALEDIRSWHSAKGEVPQVRNLLESDAIRRLNTVAATLYDDNFGMVRFYGGMIHRFPTAKFDVLNGATKLSRSVNRELADFLLVAVFTEEGPHGAHVVRTRRACLVQAKLDCSSSGARVFNLDPTTQDIPERTDEEQFYLLNQWPEFELSCAIAGQKFNLKALDTLNRPLAKYCFLWDEPTAKTRQLPPLWPSSWQCAKPEGIAPADTPLGSLLARMIDSDMEYGKDFQATPPLNDWDRLMNTLTEECRVSTWSNESKLADPAGVSFIDGICAYASLLQHARSPWQTPYFSLHSYLHRSITTDLQWSKDPGLPVLVISVSSFNRRQRSEDREWNPRRAIREAISKLKELQ